MRQSIAAGRSLIVHTFVAITTLLMLVPLDSVHAQQERQRAPDVLFARPAPTRLTAAMVTPAARSGHPGAPSARLTDTIVVDHPTGTHFTTNQPEIHACFPDGLGWLETEEGSLVTVTAGGDEMDWEYAAGGCPIEGISSSPTLQAGRNEVVIMGCDDTLDGFGQHTNCASTTLVYWYDDPTKTYGATTSPDGGVVTHVSALPGSGYTQFQVANTGDTHQEVTISITGCSGVLTSCAFTDGGGTSKAINLLNGTSPAFGVSYQISTAGSGTVTLNASALGGPSFSDNGTVNVTASTSGGTGGLLQVVTREINPGTAISRNVCLSVPIRKYVSVECGDLRLVQPLPATTTMNKERAPALTYLSRHAIPGSVLAADITVDTSLHPNAMMLIMKIPGKDTVSRTMTWNSGWNDGQARRMVLPFNAKAKSVATGAYVYSMEVRAMTNGAPTNTLVIQGDTLVVVDRSASQFGVGWWLQGLEQLSDNTPAPTLKLWIGGDGSTRLYTRQSDTTIWTVVPTVDRPDTLRWINTGGTITWRRSLGNNAYVEFDNAGRHIKTVNDAGHTTRFVHSATALDSIVLPVPSGSGAVPAYTFTYSTVSGAPALDTIKAPKNPSTSHRRLTVTRNGYNRVPTGFNATDWPSATSFGHWNTGGVVTADGLIMSMGDYPYTTGTFYLTWGSGNLLTGFSASGTSTICPAEGSSLLSCESSAVVSGSVSTSINGPRTDVADTTRIWPTRYGAPRQVRDALGNSTVIYRENSTFPQLVTKTVSPSGFTQRMAYNARGLADSSIAVDPLGTSTDAVTLYSWHSTLDRVTQTTSPTGDVMTFSYDTSGFLTYQQDGRGASTRTNFTLDATHRLEYVQPPSNTSGQRYRIEYDSYLGNILKTTTPLGFVTETTRDTIGRVVKVIAPIDSNPSSSVKTRRDITYNAWNCVTSTTDKVYSTGVQPTYSFSSISGTASNSDLSVSNTCVGADVVVSNVNGIAHPVYRNVFGQEVCALECGYDYAGNMIWRVTSAGTVTMEYDAANRLAKQTTTTGGYYGRYLMPGEEGYGDGPLAYGGDFPSLTFSTAFPYFTSSLTIPTVEALFTYDANGNMLTANNFDARVKRSYYPNGLIKTDSLRIRTYTTTGTPDNDFTSHLYGIKYYYDLSGRRDSMQVPTNVGYGCTLGSSSGCMQRYHYLQHVGAADTVKSIFGHAYAFTYDSTSRLVTRKAPGGVQLDWVYDIDDRVTRRLERRNVSGTPVTVHLDSLWYDARGKIRKASLNGDADAYSLSQFAYDRHGYLAASEFQRAASPTTTNQEFVYDPSGNISSSTKDRNIAQASSSNTFDEAGRLTAQSRTVPGGNLVVATDFNAAVGAVVLKSALEFDISGDPIATGKGYESAAWHQMDGKIRFFQRAGQDTTPETRFVFEEYRYDALGRRVLVRSRGHTGCSASFCKSAMERYIWDGSQLLAEIRVPGDSGKSDAALEADTSTISAHYGRILYIHAGGIDAPVGLDRNGSVIVPHANWRGFYDAGTDTLGSGVTATVNWIGREQDPFMEAQLPRTVNGWSGSLLRAQQDQSGLMYRRNRYYDPSTGRFTQTDPIGLSGGINLYRYADSDPVNRADAFGLLSTPTPYPGCDFMAGECDDLSTVDQGGGNVPRTGGGGGPPTAQPPVSEYAACVQRNMERAKEFLVTTALASVASLWAGAVRSGRGRQQFSAAARNFLRPGTSLTWKTLLTRVGRLGAGVDLIAEGVALTEFGWAGLAGIGSYAITTAALCAADSNR